MEDTKAVKLTPGRMSLIKALSSGKLTWGELRKVYYGPERSKSKASTSFVGQLAKLQELNVIVKVSDGYELGEAGTKLFAEHREEIEAGEFKSAAQLNFKAPEVVVEEIV